MKKKIVVAVVLILVLLCAISTFTKETEVGKTILVYAVNEYGLAEKIECDADPFIKQGRTMIPISAIAKALDLELVKNKSEKTIAISNDDNKIIFSTKGPKIEVNGGEERLVIVPEMKKGSLLVPLRFVCDKFGYNVAWEEDTSENISYVWISPYDLLSKKDVEQGRMIVYDYVDGDNILRENSETYRGIKLGASYDEVIECYGEPHNVYDDGNIIEYYGCPKINAGKISMVFTFENNRLAEVRVKK